MRSLMHGVRSSPISEHHASKQFGGSCFKICLMSFVFVVMNRRESKQSWLFGRTELVWMDGSELHVVEYRSEKDVIG
jgi:hypothetical protein